MLLPPTIFVQHYSERFKIMDYLIIGLGIETRLKNSEVFIIISLI
jgi:hypothetical protein